MPFFISTPPLFTNTPFYEFIFRKQFIFEKNSYQISLLYFFYHLSCTNIRKLIEDANIQKNLFSFVCCFL